MMPALSIDLAGPKAPDRCQACGARHDEPAGPDGEGRPILAKLDVWREHDESDTPLAVFVVLCRPCSGKLIEPHPRLYARTSPWAPIPGVLPICVDCRHRVGTSCPESRAHRGTGVHLSYPEPTAVHFRRARPARSGWETIYRGPVTACDAREVSP